MGETDANPGTASGEDLLRAMVESAQDAIYAMDRDFTLLSWNPAAEALFGYRADEIVGHCADLLVPPERRADQREILSLIDSGARVERFRTLRLHRDGSWIPVTVAVSPLRDPGGTLVGLTVIARPVSDRERLESNFQALLEAAPDAVVGIADDGRIVLTNGQAEKLFGVPRNGLLGKPINKLLPPSAPDCREPGDDAPDRTDLRIAATSARRADGSTVPVEVSTSILVTEEGRIRCAVIRDITDRVRAQDQFLQLQAEADRAQVEARLQRAQRLEGLGQLAGGVAHDFNNLIAVISNYATFIAEAAEEGGMTDLAADAAQIMKAAGRGSDLTHQLLAFARREVVRAVPLDLNAVVREIEEMLRRSIGEHITLAVRLAEDLPAVTADPGQIHQVLVNLAVNARDAMPKGGDLTIETGRYDVDAAYAAARPHVPPGHYVRLRVSDTGTGMPPEVVARVFEPFYTTKPAGKGTGLGLATVYGIVTAAAGDLSVDSETGVGTTFTILLPATDAAPVGRPAVTAKTPATYRRASILAVEDEPALRDVLNRILTSAGHEVLLAPDGPAALRLAAERAHPIDVLLTDVVMPHMLGKDLAERLTAVSPGTLVLFMSGYARPVLAAQGTLDPGVALVEKPFSKLQLLEAIQDGLERRATRTFGPVSDNLSCGAPAVSAALQGPPHSGGLSAR